jgi:hypothetical protein
MRKQEIQGLAHYFPQYLAFLAVLCLCWALIDLLLGFLVSPDTRAKVWTVTLGGAFVYFVALVVMGVVARPSADQAISRLQVLDARTVDFYDAAAAYLSRRLRSVRNSSFGIMLFGLAPLLVFWAQKNWVLAAVWCLPACLFGFLGWVPFLEGRSGIRLTRLAREADEGGRSDALRQLAGGRPFRCDRVGAFILQQLGSEGAQRITSGLQATAR